MHVRAKRVQTNFFRRDWRASATPFRAALVGIAVIALGVRLFHLFNQPMRLDEAQTFLDFVLRPLPDAISNYSIANNHILHTFLVWLSVRLFGYAEWAVRFPAFIAGLLIVPATYFAARALSNSGGTPLSVEDRGAALIATALAAVLPGLILYSANARGYSMVCLAFVLLIHVANALADEETVARWMGFCLLIALGGATIPVMLYPAGAVSLWLLAERLRRHGWSSTVGFVIRLGCVLAVAGLVAAAAYVPAIQRFGAESISGNKFVTPYTWDRFLSALPQFVRHFDDTIGLGIPQVLMLVFALAGFVPLVTRGKARGKLFTLALTTGFWCVALLVLTRRPPPPRVWLFLAPLLCIYVGIASAHLITWLSQRVRVADQMLLAGLAVLLAGSIGGAATRSTVFDMQEPVGWVRDIAQYILAETRADDRLIVGSYVSPQLDYYLFVKGGKRFADLEAPSRSERMLLIVDEFVSQTPAVIQAERPDVDWSRYSEPVQLMRSGSASIWEAQRRETP